jgi:hypothetical protein
MAFLILLHRVAGEAPLALRGVSGSNEIVGLDEDAAG